MHSHFGIRIQHFSGIASFCSQVISAETSVCKWPLKKEPPSGAGPPAADEDCFTACSGYPAQGTQAGLLCSAQ